MFSKRLSSALIGIVLLFSILLFGNVLIIRIAVAIGSLMALYELYCAFGYIKEKMLVALGVVSVLCVTFGQIFDIKFIIPLIFIYVLFLSISMILYHNVIRFYDMTAIFFFTIYIPFFLTNIVFVRNMAYGEFLIWLIFGGAWLSDTFAYFVGMAFGRHKLCPNISPKKTVEGAIGGVMGTCILFLLYGYVIYKFANINVHFLNMFILALLCGGISIVGDLTASLIKRELKLKDFGNVMPGHGGVLDRFDSVLFVAPLVYSFLLNFKVFY